MEKFVGRWHVDEGVSFGTENSEEELDGMVTVVTRETITTYDRDENVKLLAL